MKKQIDPLVLRLEEHAKTHGLTFTQIAKDLGRSTASVSAWRRGTWNLTNPMRHRIDKYLVSPPPTNRQKEGPTPGQLLAARIEKHCKAHKLVLKTFLRTCGFAGSPMFYQWRKGHTNPEPHSVERIEAALASGNGTAPPAKPKPLPAPIADLLAAKARPQPTFSFCPRCGLSLTDTADKLNALGDVTMDELNAALHALKVAKGIL